MLRTLSLLAGVDRRPHAASRRAALALCRRCRSPTRSRSASARLLTVVFVSGVTLLVFWQRRQRSGDDKTNLLLSALGRLVGRRAVQPYFTLFRRTLSGTDLPLSPGTMKIRQILAEIRTTEAAYVATLRLLVKCQRALEGERLLGRAEAAEVFTSAETLMQVNSELLTRLPERRRRRSRDCARLRRDRAVRRAILRNSAQFLRSPRRHEARPPRLAGTSRSTRVLRALLRRARARSSASGGARRSSGASPLRGECGGQPLESLLIAPVQRLCKYPLLLRDHCWARSQPNSADRPALEAAAASSAPPPTASTADVRAAENAATMRRVAIEIDYTLPNNTPLLSPTRTLLHDADAEQLRIDEPELRGSHRRTPARLLLFSDGLLVAERAPGAHPRDTALQRPRVAARAQVDTRPAHHAKVSRDEGDAGGDEGGAYVFVGGDGDDEGLRAVGRHEGGRRGARLRRRGGAMPRRRKASSNRFSIAASPAYLNFLPAALGAAGIYRRLRPFDTLLQDRSELDRDVGRSAEALGCRAAVSPHGDRRTPGFSWPRRARGEPRRSQRPPSPRPRWSLTGASPRCDWPTTF